MNALGLKDPADGSKQPLLPLKARSRSTSSVIEELRQQPHALKGMGLVATSAVCFSIMSTLVKYGTYYMTSMECIFWRSIVAFVLNFGVLKYSGHTLHVDKRDRLMLFLRSLAGFSSISFGFYAFSQMVLADASVIVFTSPVITFFFGACFLNESIDPISFACALCSLGGLACVVRPGFIFGYEDEGASGSWLAICSALLGAVGQAFVFISVRKLKGVPALVIVHYFMMFSVVCSIAYMAFVQHRFVANMPISVWFAVIFSGVFTFLGQMFLTRGFQLEKAGIASVMRYFDVVCVFIWDALLLRETINVWSIVGALIICSSAIIIALRKAHMSVTELVITTMEHKKLFVFGLGFSASRAAVAFQQRGYEVVGCVRTQETALQLEQAHSSVFCAQTRADGSRNRNVFVFSDGQWDVAANDGVTVEQALAGSTHLIVSVPTSMKEGEEDPVLAAMKEKLVATVSPTAVWVAYLSTIGVYGETHGVAVDEDAPVQSTVRRSQMRIAAERQWLDSGLPCHVFRIAGIYGPGRGNITKVRSGTASRIHIPGRLFNRIHVDDIVGILEASAAKPRPGAIYNVADDEPAPADVVTAYACELLGVPVPPSRSWEEAEATMSAMAKSFYVESKVVKNDRIKDELGVKLKYPSYREGLLAQVLEEEQLHVANNASADSSIDSLVVVANIGSLRPEPYLDLRQVCFRLSRALRRPVIPCSFRFSNRIDASLLHGIPAKTFETVLTEFLTTPSSKSSKEVVVLPLFFGNSSTLTDFLPEVGAKCWEQLTTAVSMTSLTLRVGRCLVDVDTPTDDRIARMLVDKISQVTLPDSATTSEPVSVIVLDHGTPSRQVHEAREIVGRQVKALLTGGRYVYAGTACMERRDGPEYDFNDPLLLHALDYHQVTTKIVIVALLFLSQGRHAGENGDIETIVADIRQARPDVTVLIAEPIGAHPLLTDVLHDRYRHAMSNEAAPLLFETQG
ncbi:TPA: hypothetical protein N0F65_001266 [Lagenidium giganteum]|uniref:EamA domain-containing protein n=1 Tax=Lagenidium giganteum TaxID=4803 RepID=A0AAV2YQY5_9STRA|nr:TPA: hypothetical protein N0F65_001266 [Lagenidium giganteum]